ncbi:D-alanyl-D-alanine carboxypeptidase [Streptomyces gamaensis]|uniref:D-alanyl-D-alanine carboxypeptidase n=1 Tax=Streptomyces gamaensis TaxID=1763542 RepID=A0ABW0Z1R3_9ACTN
MTASGEGGGAAAADQPTTVLSTVRSGRDGDGSGVDQPTAVLGAVRPGKGDTSDADQPTTVLGTVRAKGKAAAEEPTTVLKTVRADGRDGDEGSRDKAGKAAPSWAGRDSATAPADQPTAVIDVLPGKDGSRNDKSSKDGAESDAERTSQFVPLKSLDDAPAKPPRPVKTEKPEKAGKTGQGEKAEQPGKNGKDAKAAEPAIPVKVAPPTEKPAGAGAAAKSKAKKPKSEHKSEPVAEQKAEQKTEQKPAEPQAPLDLLAQLTNTPPPPETPTRTIVRRVKVWTPLVVLLGIIFTVVQVFRPLPEAKLVLTGKSSFQVEGSALSLPWPSEGQAIVDVDGLGRVGSYGEMKPLPIGSVAKVMTTYLILRDHPLKKGDDGPKIDVDQKAEEDFVNGDKENESVVEVKKGQTISEKEALEAVMLPSANNVARLLARWDAGNEEAFIKKMNDTAKELGMTNTTYTDASGLLESTVSTAEDQVKLGKKAMQDPVFREMAKATQYTSTTASGTGSGAATQKVQRNFNKLVPAYGVVGIKTGSTTKAGGNLLFAAEKKVGDSTQLIIGAVFGQHKSPIIDTATDYSKNLILTAGKALTTSTVVKKGEVVGHVDDGLGGTTPVVATKDLTVAGWPGLKADLKLDSGGKNVPHSAKSGTEVGDLTVGTGDNAAKVPVALQKDLAEPGFGAKVTRLG